MIHINLIQKVGDLTRQLWRNTSDTVQTVADEQAATLANVIKGMMAK